MQIKYMQHAPHPGEPFGTVFVWFSDVSEDEVRNGEKIINLLSNLSDKWEWPIRIETESQCLAWHWIRAEKWHTVLAILSFSGGTEIFPPKD